MIVVADAGPVNYCPVRRIRDRSAGFQPAVSPTSKSARLRHAQRVWKPATQQTWKSALQRFVVYLGDLAVSH